MKHEAVIIHTSVLLLHQLKIHLLRISLLKFHSFLRSQIEQSPSQSLLHSSQPKPNAFPLYSSSDFLGSLPWHVLCSPCILFICIHSVSNLNCTVVDNIPKTRSEQTGASIYKWGCMSQILSRLSRGSPRLSAVRSCSQGDTVGKQPSSYLYPGPTVYEVSSLSISPCCLCCIQCLTHLQLLT